MTKTQIKIIEAAEIEFAERGFQGASVRSITARAGVNIAAIHYHFGSKSELFQKMVLYRLEPINAERLKALDLAYERNGGAPLSVPELVEIIVRPLLAGLMGQGPNQGKWHFMRAMGRGFSEDLDFCSTLYKDVLAKVIERFGQALAHSLGEHCQKETILYCLHFLSCSMLGAMTQHNRLVQLPFENRVGEDLNAFIDRLVVFIAGGIAALDQANRPAER